MAFCSFEDLDVWKRASRLAVRIYQELDNCRDYGLKDQMTRAVVSIAQTLKTENYMMHPQKMAKCAAVVTADLAIRCIAVY